MLPSLVAAVLIGGVATTPALAFSPHQSESGIRLSPPSLYQSPRFRWWWPGGWADPTEVRSEINDIIEAGFGGGEIGDVEDSVTVDLDPQIYGWGQKRWNTAVLAAYEEAAR
jgi:hypothetical protein